MSTFRMRGDFGALVRATDSSAATKEHMKRLDGRRRWVRRLQAMRRQRGRLVGFAASRVST